MTKYIEQFVDFLYSLNTLNLRARSLSGITSDPLTRSSLEICGQYLLEIRDRAAEGFAPQHPVCYLNLDDFLPSISANPRGTSCCPLNAFASGKIRLLLQSLKALSLNFKALPLDFQLLLPPKLILDPEIISGISTRAPSQSLMENIRDEGLREDLICWHDYLIDGRDRYLACLRYGIPYGDRIKQRPCNNKTEAMKARLEINLLRRHFNRWEREYYIGKQVSLTQGKINPKSGELNRTLGVQEQHGIVHKTAMNYYRLYLAIENISVRLSERWQDTDDLFLVERFKELLWEGKIKMRRNLLNNVNNLRTEALERAIKLAIAEGELTMPEELDISIGEKVVITPARGSRELYGYNDQLARVEEVKHTGTIVLRTRNGECLAAKIGDITKSELRRTPSYNYQLNISRAIRELERHAQLLTSEDLARLAKIIKEAETQAAKDKTKKKMEFSIPSLS